MIDWDLWRDFNCPSGADDEQWHPITCPECIWQDTCLANPENNGEFETEDNDEE